MTERLHTVGEVARMARVTVRTLHHYDEIDLLVPSRRTRAGYRLYSRADVERLQQIRFHRELGMPLEEIREILDAPDFDAAATLREHRRRLAERLEQTERLIATIDRMLETPEGEDVMSQEQLFEGFQPEEHAAEAKERWGHTPSWKEAQHRTARYRPEDWVVIKAEAEEIVQGLAACRDDGEPPDSEAAMDLAEEHREHIDRWYYACSPTMHAGLAEMYVADPRFAAHFDRHGEGLSEYVAAAIRANAARS